MTTKKKRTRKPFVHGAVRGYPGNPCKAKDYATCIATFTGFPCPAAGLAAPETWHLELRAARSVTDGWWALKLYADKRVRVRANYWLTWHDTEQRLGRVPYYYSLQKNRPELLEAVEKVLIGFHIGLYQMSIGLAPRGQFPADKSLYSYGVGFQRVGHGEPATTEADPEEGDGVLESDDLDLL